MIPTPLRLALTGVLSGGGWTALCHALAGDDRRAFGLTFAPFGWLSVLLLQLLAALPLGFVAGAWLRRRQACHNLDARGWAVLGLLSGLAATLLAAPLAEAARDGALGLDGLAFGRLGLVLLMLVPWCTLAMPPGESPGESPRESPGEFRRPSPAVLGACLLLAIVPPGLHARAVISAQMDQVRDLLSRERLVRAERVLTGLAELGADQPLDGQTLPAVRKALHRSIATIRRAVSAPLPPEATPEQKRLRVLQLIQIHELDMAVRLLEPMASGSAADTALLGVVYQELERWAESDRCFQAVLDEPSAGSSTAAERQGLDRTAIEGLVFNARATRRPADVERWLRRGWDLIPGDEAYWRFELGRHYAAAGLPARAMEEFRASARIDPRRFSESATREIDRLRLHTPACLLR